MNRYFQSIHLASSLQHNYYYHYHHHLSCTVRSSESSWGLHPSYCSAGRTSQPPRTWTSSLITQRHVIAVKIMYDAVACVQWRWWEGWWWWWYDDDAVLIDEDSGSMMIMYASTMMMTLTSDVCIIPSYHHTILPVEVSLLTLIARRTPWAMCILPEGSKPS